MAILINSIYAKRREDDGYRVLVDDCLPDSMDEYKAGVDLWLRVIMPSDGLGKLLRNNPEMWDVFKARYFNELDGLKHTWIEMLVSAAGQGNVTLYFSCSDHEHNNAVAIKEYIEANSERFGLMAA